MKVLLDIPEEVLNDPHNYCCYVLADHIKGQPKITLNAILNKIRAEIADLDDADYDYEGYYKAVTDAVNIVDKYRAESE